MHPAYGPWRELQVDDQFRVRLGHRTVAEQLRHVKQAAANWQHHLGGRKFVVYELRDAIMVRRVQ